MDKKHRASDDKLTVRSTQPLLSETPRTVRRRPRHVRQWSRMWGAARAGRKAIKARSLPLSMYSYNGNWIYDTTNNKFLAVVWSFLILLPYVEGSKFFLCTNHRANRWIFHFKKCTGLLTKRIICFLEYAFTVIPQPGAYHEATDTVSQILGEKWQADDNSDDKNIQTMDISSSDRMKCFHFKV